LSFAFISPSFPWARRAKLFLVCVILAGCGGSGSGKWQQVQSGALRFDAPAGWSVSGATASDGPVNRVGVTAFRLLRPYDPARRPAVARELDGVAARLAKELGGTVRAGEWLTVGGLDARGYAIGFADKTEEITFVLEGRNEYQLLCRRVASTSDDACRRLVETFRVT
jgi:hypothetical protein